MTTLLLSATSGKLTAIGSRWSSAPVRAGRRIVTLSGDGRTPKYQIYTIQLGSWRIAEAQQIKLLNTTAASGIKAFAPDFAHVMAYKRGEMDEATYTEHYLEKMERSRIENLRIWDYLETYPRLAVACYCKAGQFCHRHLFAPLAKAHLESYGLEVELMGELKRSSKTAA